jgi:hypothetical protein
MGDLKCYKFRQMLKEISLSYVVIQFRMTIEIELKLYFKHVLLLGSKCHIP